MAASTSRSTRPSAARLAGLAAVALLVFLIGVAALQDRLLYFPDAASVEGTLVATGQARAGAWPGRDEFRGALIEPTTPARGTAIVFHGNAGHAGHRGEYADRLGAYGWRVILAEYPGYGARPGTPGEAVLVEDARQTLALARRRFGGPLLVVGESLGAAVAAGVVGADPQATDGLVLITPWDRLASIAAHHYPWLPVRLLLADRYDSVRALEGYRGPTVVVLAGDDRIVPARFGRALFEALRGRRALVEIPGADHNDWMGRVDDAWWTKLLAAAVGAS